MEKQEVTLSAELVGRVLAEDVLSVNGTLLLSKGLKLRMEDISHLLERNIEKVTIEGKVEKQVDEAYEEVSYKRISFMYDDKLTVVESFFQQVATRGTFDKKQVDGFDQLITNILKAPHLFLQLRSIQDTDQYTYKHSLNVGIISAMLAKLMGFKEKDMIRVGQAGILHDIGKAKIPEQILNKPTTLTSKEFKIIQKHPQFGHEILIKNKIEDDYILSAALMHHERMNGTGYPLGWKGSQISLVAQIVAVADVYDAILSKRVYKDPLSLFHAFEEMKKLAFQKELNPDIVFLLLKYISSLIEGQNVQLNNGIIGKVVFASPFEMDRPIILYNEEYIDLQQRRDLYIKDIPSFSENQVIDHKK